MDMTPSDGTESLETPQGVAFEKRVVGSDALIEDVHYNHVRWPDDSNPQACWNNFWIRSVWEGREPTAQEIKAELYDYHHIMEQAATVYDTITGGLVSKPNTNASAVIQLWEEKMNDEISASEQKIAFALRSKEVKKFLPDLPDDEVESLARAIIEEWYGYDRDY